MTGRVARTSIAGRHEDDFQAFVARRELRVGRVDDWEARTHCLALDLRASRPCCDQNLDRMARLVEEILDETRVRQGRLALLPEPCDLVSLVGEAVAEQIALNPERHICWVAEAPPVPVIADASRIEQVVTNLVSNAIKFSRADQKVAIRVQTQDGAARVSVHDDGGGIPLADQLHIWERFYQVEGVAVRTGSQVGFGIGLHISKAIIEGHHGEVGIDSTPGQGTTVWFTLPLASSLLALSLGSSGPEAGASSLASPPRPADREQ